MFYTSLQDEVELPDEFRDDGTRLWTRIELLTGIPIFVLSLSAKQCVDSGLGRTLLFREIEDLIACSLLEQQRYEIDQAAVLIPPELNGGSEFLLQPLQEVWTTGNRTMGLRMKLRSGKWLDYPVDLAEGLNTFTLAARF